MGSDANQGSGLSPANLGNFLCPGDLLCRHHANLRFLLAKATSTLLSAPWQPYGPAADGLLPAGMQCPQLSLEPWRDTTRCQTPLLTQPLSPTFARTSPPPHHIRTTALPSGAYTPLLCLRLLPCSSLPMLLPAAVLPAAMGLGAQGDFWKGQQGVLERAGQV